ncbi:MAG: helix-turn-helix transcriptional regulator [Acidobacteriota bacterium]
MQGYWLGYLFVSFAIGVACFGVALAVAWRRRDAVSRCFLALYGALSVMVTASLLSAFGETAPGVISAAAQQVFRYLESIVGLYGVMLTLPLLLHRVFRVREPRRERVLVGVVVATLVLQHLTEYVLGSTPWDERGDWLEDGVLLAIVAYSLWLVVTRWRSAEAERPLADRISLLLLIGVPGFVYDLFLSEGWGLRWYPLWYCLTSVVMVSTLVRGEEIVSPQAADGWGLSAREAEVADQVARGLSNKDIATTLHISPNTVKTHLRTIFEKAGVRSRFELISRMSRSSGAKHPEG